MHFMHPRVLPVDRKATYIRIMASYRPTKANPFRIKWTVRGNHIDYPDIKYTPNTEMQTAKILLNRVLSIKYIKLMSIDIKDLYLNTKLKRYECMMMHNNMIPEYHQQVKVAHTIQQRFDPS